MYTTFAFIDEDDRVYFGQLDLPKRQISFEQYASALQPIPDEDIFPELSSSEQLTLFQNASLPDTGFYIKRPKMIMYEEFKEKGALDIIHMSLLEEICALEAISKHPHPNIVRYHGCRVRRGRITGLVLDKYEYDLEFYVRCGIGTINKEAFMAALVSAVQHLHANDLAHNDITPSNIMVNDSGMPVLIDFDSCYKVGDNVLLCHSTEGWRDEKDDYRISKASHDVFALSKICVWLDNPTFEE
jgi:serine/threonine protein kinase